MKLFADTLSLQILTNDEESEQRENIFDFIHFTNINYIFTRLISYKKAVHRFNKAALPVGVNELFPVAHHIWSCSGETVVHVDTICISYC